MITHPKYHCKSSKRFIGLCMKFHLLIGKAIGLFIYIYIYLSLSLSLTSPFPFIQRNKSRQRMRLLRSLPGSDSGFQRRCQSGQVLGLVLIVLAIDGTRKPLTLVFCNIRLISKSLHHIWDVYLGPHKVKGNYCI